jgi:hypothetical protein
MWLRPNFAGSTGSQRSAFRIIYGPTATVSLEEGLESRWDDMAPNASRHRAGVPSPDRVRRWAERDIVIGTARSNSMSSPPRLAGERADWGYG